MGVARAQGPWVGMENGVLKWWEVGSGQRYIICVTRCASQKACNSDMSVCFLTCTKCKNVRQNLIPSATV